MSALVVPKPQNLTDLDAKMALADYVGAKLHLFSNNVNPTPLNVLADFTEVIASGVVAEVVTWTAAFFDANGVAVSSTGQKLFIQTGATNDSCFGVYLTNGAGTKLLAAARLDVAPFNFVGIGTTLPLLLNAAQVGGNLIVPPGP